MDMSIKSVKATAFRHEKLRYCPDWSASNKPGRPKKSDKVLTLTEKMVLASSGKKRKRQVKLFCKICEKFNHTTADCFKKPINRKLDDTLQNIAVASEEDEDGDEGRV
jgi:hypothetical protein